MNIIRDGLTSLVNKITGHGTARDKTGAGSYYFTHPTDQQLQHVYRASWLAKKGVTAPASDMLREGWDWQVDAKDRERIELFERQIDLVRKVRTAMVWERLYGGAVLLMGTGDSTPDLVMRPRAELKFLTVLPKSSVTCGQIITDPMNPEYGKPSYVQVINSTARIHPSRVVLFTGLDTGTPVSIGSQVFGDSVLAAVMGEIMTKDYGLHATGQQLLESSTTYYKIKNLVNLIGSEGGEDKIRTFVQLMEQMKSSLNAAVIDADSDISQFTANYAGLPEIVRMIMQLVSGGFDVPVTRFLGESPAGLSATGESDIRNYYDGLSSRQESDLRPTIQPLMNLVARTALGSDTYDYTFNPLWQLTEAEEIANDEKRLNILGTLVDRNLLVGPAQVKLVENILRDGRTFPGAAEILDEFPITPADPADDEEDDDPASVTDAAPQPLYVRRDVLNGADIQEWFKGQGLETTLEPSDMHVTICYSRTPVDWMAAGQSFSDKVEIGAGGPRMMDRFGDATVMLITNWEIEGRHRALRDMGASWDHAEYQPHITITYRTDKPINEIAPYRGPIILGPEIFEALDLDWKGKVAET